MSCRGHHLTQYCCCAAALQGVSSVPGITLLVLWCQPLYYSKVLLLICHHFSFVGVVRERIYLVAGPICFCSLREGNQRLCSVGMKLEDSSIPMD